MTQLGEAFVPIRATMDKLDGDLAEARGRIEGALSGIAGGVQALGGLALTGVAVGIVAIGAALGTIGGLAFNAGMLVDEAMDTIAIKSGATGDELGDLQESFENVFTSVPTDAGTAADVIGTLNARLGITGDQLDNLAVPLAQVTELIGGDAVARTELFTRVLGDWGVEVENGPAVLDKFFAASQATGAGLDDLMAKVVQFGSPLRLMGFSLDESVALFAKWEQEGVNAELVMGSLRIAAGKFADANVPLQEGLQQTMDAIMGASSESEALAIAMDVFGARAGPDMAAAILEGRFSIEDLIATMEDSEGAINDTMEATADWPEMWTLIKNKATLALAPIGSMLMDLAGRVMPLVEAGFAWFEETLLPVLENVAQVIGDVLSGLISNLEEGMSPLNAFIEAIWDIAPQWLLDALVNLRDNILPGLMSFFENTIQPIMDTVTQFVSWKDILIALGIAIASVVIPAIGSILGAVLPIIAVGVLLIGAIALLRNAWENDWGGIQTKVTEVWEGTIKPALMELWQWLQVNVPIALQFLADYWSNVLLPAITAVGDWVTGTLFPALGQLAAWLGETIPPIIQTLADYWTGTLWPAIQAVADWVTGTLFPALGDLAAWLEETIPPAIQTLADFWENTLLPAIEKVWSFIQDDLVPLFESVVELVEVTLTLALTVLQGAWENILLPALETVWAFIQDNLVPIIEDLVEILGPPIQDVVGAVKGLMDDFATGLGGVKGAISGLIGFIDSLIEKLQNIEIPDILTPGSPTPFEMGLRGVLSTVKDLNPELERMAARLGTALDVGSFVADTERELQIGLQNGGSPFASSSSFEDFALAGPDGGDIYNLHLTGPSEESRGVIRDFALLRALAGKG